MFFMLGGSDNLDHDTKKKYKAREVRTLLQQKPTMKKEEEDEYIELMYTIIGLPIILWSWVIAIPLWIYAKVSSSD